MQETSKYTVFNIREYLGDGSHRVQIEWKI